MKSLHIFLSVMTDISSISITVELTHIYMNDLLIFIRFEMFD